MADIKKGANEPFLYDDQTDRITGLKNSDATEKKFVYTDGSSGTISELALGTFTEGVVTIGTVGAAHTLNLVNGTVHTATLTASTATTFTMPTATAGKSFTLLLKQAATTGNGTATFTGVKWNAATPTMTATAGRMDIFTFVADGTNWYGSVIQNFTP